MGFPINKNQPGGVRRGGKAPAAAAIFNPTPNALFTLWQIIGIGSGALCLQCGKLLELKLIFTGLPQVLRDAN